MSDTYEVTVYKSRMPLPVLFAYHTWVVVTGQGTTDRFDLMGFIRDGQGVRTGHVYKNYNPPTLGCPILAFGQKTFYHQQLAWPAEVVYKSCGETGSLAHRAYDLLHHRLHEYPYTHGPFELVLGPNCNTFTQRVIGEARIPCELPWGAFGKGFPTKPEQQQSD